MKRKIKTKDWQVAVVHWLIAGFAMPFLFSAVFGFFVKKIAENFGVIVWVAILGEAIKFFIVWISIIYSAKFITSRLTIKNKLNVVKISTALLVLFVGGFRLISFNSSDLMGYIFSYMHLISLLVIAPFFYFLSQNYIVKNKE